MNDLNLRIELEANKALARKLEDKDADLFIHARPGKACVIEGRVGPTPFRHEGSIVLGLAQFLKLLEGK